METRIVPFALVLVGIVSIAGCAKVSHEIPREQRNFQEVSVLPREIPDLAGRWEYADNTGSYPITLNAEGKGTYEWKEGRFETLSLQKGLWTGIWVQKGNDREGGFELTFSENADVAEGEWWYTRIGKDHDPLQSGGRFTMTRSPVTQLAQ